MEPDGSSSPDFEGSVTVLTANLEKDRKDPRTLTYRPPHAPTQRDARFGVEIPLDRIPERV